MEVSYQLLNLKDAAARNRVGWFFRHESDKMMSIPSLFDVHRWGQCDEAIVAEESSQLVGVVTISLTGIQDSGIPTLDTVYVQRSYQGRGIGSELFKQGLQRLIERGAPGRIRCDLQNQIMVHLVEKMPNQLKDRLHVHESFRYGDLSEELEYLEDNLPGKG